MTPIRLNIPSSSSPLHEEENQEEYPSHVLLTLKPTSPLSTACSSSTPCEEKKDHGVRDQPLKGADKKEGEEGGQEEEAEEEKLLDQADPGFSTSTGSGTEDDHLIPVRSSPPVMSMGSQGDQINEGNNSTTKPVVILHKQEAHHDHGDHGGSSTNQYCKVDGSHVMKWMSSKMRVMKKMANYNNPDQTPSDDTKPTACNELQQPFSPFQSRLQRSPPLCDDDNSTTNINSPKIRVCSDCNTTKTPLWRSGPQGPKSLCNACGIRQRKARRAMAAAAANGTQLLSVETSMRSSSSSTNASNKAIKEKRSSSSGSTDGFSCRQYKKRCKLGAAGPPRSRKKIRFDEFTISTLSKSSAATFHQAVFPQDEEEAAILLMALSCGLVRG